VLRHRRTRRSGHQRGRGRDVERAGAVAAGTRRVHEVVAPRAHGDDVLAHRLGTARDLRDGLALRPQGDEEAGDLGGRRLPGHDLGHDGTRLPTGEVASVEEAGEGLLDHACAREAHGAARADQGRLARPEGQRRTGAMSMDLSGR
jgi:hypothetical protein